MDVDPLLWSIDETAKQLSVCAKTVRRLLDNKILPKVKLGRATRVPTKAVREYVAMQVEGAQNAKCVGSAMRSGESICHINAKTVPSGGSASPTRAAKELGELLERRTERKR